MRGESSFLLPPTNYHLFLSYVQSFPNIFSFCLPGLLWNFSMEVAIKPVRSLWLASPIKNWALFQLDSGNDQLISLQGAIPTEVSTDWPLGLGEGTYLVYNTELSRWCLTALTIRRRDFVRESLSLLNTWRKSPRSGQTSGQLTDAMTGTGLGGVWKAKRGKRWSWQGKEREAWNVEERRLHGREWQRATKLQTSLPCHQVLFSLK